MAKHQKELNKKKVLEALEKSLGIITPACKEANISRDTFYTYLKEDEEFKKAVDEITEIQTDFVENQLFKKIKEGSERSILFYMRYKGRKRGYTESVDITTNGKGLDGGIKIIFVDGDKSDTSSEENESL
jgi:hypothetical protein